MERIKRFHAAHVNNSEQGVFEYKVQQFLDMTDVIEVLNVERNSNFNGLKTSIDVTVKYKFIERYAQVFDDYIMYGSDW
ncbi:hypothetical protein BHM04_04865 [Macrococcus sp. IME1552]|nr:hypothetical protein [Macrococcus sp. IME1552]ATD30548.1 hypothetical protein BHM04_04865 [Macrococcus sp. IME1552]